MKTASTNKKIREIITMVKEDRLVPRPEFQRRLVWTRDDKNLFLDSILKGYLFPEIYLADGDVDVNSGEGSQLLVDGLQRVSTIYEYFQGDPNLRLTNVPFYKDLSEGEKRAFLQYDVAVRDLGQLSRLEIVEVFRRLNATKYSLIEIEVNNAIYQGALKKYADKISENEFLTQSGIFTATDLRRMGDLRFAILLVGTMLNGYFNRDDEFGDILLRYNDDFIVEGEIDKRISRVFDFISECGFERNSRLWRKADLFTMIIEIDQLINIKQEKILSSDVVDRVQKFFSDVGSASIAADDIASIYYKAALQASNDRVNRIRRGLVLNGIIQGKSPPNILADLSAQGLR